MANFWTSPNRDPKRAFRFTVSISSFEGGASWYAKSATKPKFTVTSTEHKYINHTFHYPGRVEWENVTITIVDPVDPNAASSAATGRRGSGIDRAHAYRRRAHRWGWRGVISQCE